MSGLAILHVPAPGRRADPIAWIRLTREGFSLLVALVASIVTMGCATESAKRLGQSIEYVKSFEEARLCEGWLYVSYRAVTDTNSEERLRYLRVSIDAMEWSDWPADRPVLAPQSSLPPRAVPRLGLGPLPVDPIRCASPPAMDLANRHMNEGVLRNQPDTWERFGSALIDPLADHDFVVVVAQSWMAVSRRAGEGAEWALVDFNGDHRTYRSWWSYPAVALALVPAIAVDIVSFPLMILAVATHAIH